MASQIRLAVSDFLAAAEATIRGARSAWSNVDVRRTYLVVVLALLSVTLALDALGLWALFHWTAVGADASAWIRVGLWIARGVGFVVVLMLAPFVAINLCNLAFPVFSEAPFLAGMQAVSPERAASLRTSTGLPVHVAIGLSLRRLISTLIVLGAVGLLGFIPLVGPPMAFIAHAYVTSRAVGWELLDPYLDLEGLRLPEQKRLVRSNLPTVLGHGAVCAVLLGLPLLGPLTFGLLQAATATVVVERLEARVPRNE